jgi:hypothetical protein
LSCRHRIGTSEYIIAISCPGQQVTVAQYEFKISAALARRADLDLRHMV